MDKLPELEKLREEKRKLKAKAERQRRALVRLENRATLLEAENRDLKNRLGYIAEKAREYRAEHETH